MVPLDTPWNKSSCLSLCLNFSHFQEVSNTTASNVYDVRFCPHPPVSPGWPSVNSVKRSCSCWPIGTDIVHVQSVAWQRTH